MFMSLNLNLNLLSFYNTYYITVTNRSQETGRTVAVDIKTPIVIKPPKCNKMLIKGLLFRFCVFVFVVAGIHWH